MFCMAQANASIVPIERIARRQRRRVCPMRSRCSYPHWKSNDLFTLLPAALRQRARAHNRTIQRQQHKLSPFRAVSQAVRQHSNRLIASNHEFFASAAGIACFSLPQSVERSDSPASSGGPFGSASRVPPDGPFDDLNSTMRDLQLSSGENGIVDSTRILLSLAGAVTPSHFCAHRRQRARFACRVSDRRFWFSSR